MQVELALNSNGPLWDKNPEEMKCGSSSNNCSRLRYAALRAPRTLLCSVAPKNAKEIAQGEPYFRDVRVCVCVCVCLYVQNITPRAFIRF